MQSAIKPAGVGRVYFNRRTAALLGLGFASGLPLLLTSSTLSAWLSVADVDVTTIGLFSLVALPYSFKFLAAPLMDRYVPPLLGRRRGWLLITQILLMLGIAAMGFVGPTGSDAQNATDNWMLTQLAVLALVVAAFSACQDIVADAYRTDVLEHAELGAGAAVWVTAYRIALVVAASGALALSRTIGWQAVYLLMAGLMGVGIIASIFGPEPDNQHARPASLSEAVVHPFVAFVREHGKSTVVVLAVVVLFKLPDELARAMTKPLLLQELKYSEEAVALAEGWAIGLTIAGALVGGGIVARLGVVRSLWVFGILQAVSNAGFWLLSATAGGSVMMFAVMAVESLCAGLVTAGFLAFLMSLCDKRYSAFQFALLTSLMALARPILGMPTGYMVAAMGYAGFFAMTILAGLPGMALLLVLREPGISRDDDTGLQQPTLAEALAD